MEALFRLGWKPGGPHRASLEDLTVSRTIDILIWERLICGREDGTIEQQIPWLLTLVTSDNDDTSVVAITALGCLGRDAESALPILRQFAVDWDGLHPVPTLRVLYRSSAALEAVRRIELGH